MLNKPNDPSVNERQWELYRLSVVEEWPDTPLKRAVIRAIQHRLDAIDVRVGVRKEKSLAVGR